MGGLQLQPSINDLRSSAHLALINRLKGLDLSPILVYRIALLVDSAVLAMAWQWDVLNPLLLPDASQLVSPSYASWDVIQNIDALTSIDLLQYLASVEGPVPVSVVRAQYRALILISTALHSTMGTKAALQNALAQLGYPSAVIQEGQSTWGGNQYPSNQGWAVFRVLINLATVPADADFTTLVPRLTAMCNFWKPARCVLDSVQFQNYLTDTLIPPVTDFILSQFLLRDMLSQAPSDFMVASFFPLADTKTITPYFNDRYSFGSNVTFGATQPAVADGPLVVNGNAVSH
jgi:hypothetical protein